MSEQIVPPTLVNKLGHNILEIRERALLTLLAKIDNGLIFENDLAQSKEILTKLFEWFLFNPCPYEEMVLALIKRILLSDSGSVLINYYGSKTVEKELKQVKQYLDPKYHSVIDEIQEIVDAFKFQEVPPLVSDTPLSYRSGQSFKTTVPNTDTTSKCIEGYISKGSSIEPQLENYIKDEFISQETFTIDRSSTSSLQFHVQDEIMPNYSFKWQPLIETDRHVLNSVEKSLNNHSKPSEVLHSCEFLRNILLHDFPAEVFLQRPYIILSLEKSLQSCLSTRVNTSILKFFINFTRELLVRINHSNDPSIRTLKEYNKGPFCSFPDLTAYSSESVEFKEDVESLKPQEISTPKYCTSILKCVLGYLVIKPQSLKDITKKSTTNLYHAVELIEKLLCLLKKCLSTKIWNVQPHGVYYQTLKDVNDCLVLFGEAIENYRIHINTNAPNSTSRAVYLCLLYHCINFLDNFVPLDRCMNFLPKCLKNSLSISLLDIPLAKLYPEIHNTTLKYVQALSDNTLESIEKFQVVKEICDSMSAAVQFIRNDLSCFARLIAIAKKAILSLQFHKNLSFIDMLIQECSTRFSLHTNETDAANMEDVLLSLLCHHKDEVVAYSYKLCQNKVISAIGPMLNLTGTGVSTVQVVFLLRSKIIIEIAKYGISNENLEVKKYAEDIVIHLMKCKILVTDDIWDKVIEAIIPSLPVLLIYASKLTPLGRSLINVVDPDIAKDLKISTVDVVKSNSLLLFSKEELVREEAFSRLCWMLALQNNSKKFLPHLNNINDKTLPNLCQMLKKTFDVNKLRNSERFYQPSSLQNVMDLLNSPNVEPSIRRSALTQLAVMMEDYLLHDMFIERKGVESVVTIMKNALIEEDYMNYPDSIIPVVAILKIICLYNANIRYELSNDLNVYFYILRGLFLFCTDERMKSDSSILLFLLLYSTYIQGTPCRFNIAIPEVVYKKINIPFSCNIYGETSDYTGKNLTDFVMSDKSCLSSIQIHWCAEVYGGFQQLLQFDNSQVPNDIKIVEQLKMKQEDLNQIKLSSVHFSIGECLKVLEKGESTCECEEVLNALMIYIYLYNLSKKHDENFILNYLWEDHFAKYLRILPSSVEDASLLYGVLKLLRALVPFYKSEKNCWIISILKDPVHYITDVITIENSSEEYLKELSKQVLSLIRECVCQQQHLLDFHIEAKEIANPNSEWGNVIELLVENIKFQDPQQFYNLSYVDSLLSCLVHLTATLGWANKRKKSPRQILKEIITSLCDLIDAFHYGKGPTAAVSLMGLSITRNILLILNHILAEMSYLNIKNWDLLFIEDISEQNKIHNFVLLWNTRDVVLKAAVLQFFAGLIKSSRLSRDIVSDLKKKQKCLWSITLNILLDNEEASIVRENAALILANLLTHRSSTNNTQILHGGIKPFALDKETNSNPITSLLEILDKTKCVKKLKQFILCLYTTSISDSEETHEIQELKPRSSGYLYTYRSTSEISERTWDSNTDRSKEKLNISTPSLIKSIAIFLHNLIELTDQSFVEYLNEEGLIKLMFRSICVPFIEVKNTKLLSLYVDILEMNSDICVFLRKAVRCSPSCLGTILHTKDCVHVLLSLLNPKNYYVNLPQLFYLRNKLWIEIFALIGTFIECGYHVEDKKRPFEILNIILEAIYNNNPTNFVDTVCEAITCFGANELLSSVLLTLTLMLQIQCSNQFSNKDNEMTVKHSMQTLLDTVKATKCITLENSDTLKNQNKLTEYELMKYKNNLLEEIYFGEASGNDISKPKKTMGMESSLDEKNYDVWCRDL
ncbi:hypothetical protein WA026_001716 [Henosepilachna vigintioctopunctata]|uniref:Rotatin N-terminal domain-containing protein n=1 Tax=Henosepilachna vigintioctopunctata TaxID=420089 RepID=A0AAW1UIV7_9CUCU